MSAVAIFVAKVRFITLFNNNIHDILCRPTNKSTAQQKPSKLEVGIADDQAKDFDFAKTEMKYDSTGMFHWTPARSIEDCILVRKGGEENKHRNFVFFRTVTRRL